MTSQGFYIQLFSIHGLVRADDMELGRDADTGGQVKYVIELLKALGEREEVRQVDLFTRLVADKTVSDDYARPIEEVADKCRIVRLQCGGRKYMRKELLWPHLDEYVDKTIKFIKREKQLPDIVHGHYPDAGYVATQLAEIFGVPLVYTGHSLGRSKLDRLLNEGMRAKEIDKKYKINHRIRMEENILKAADLVVGSTSQEIEVQYGAYESKDQPRFKVIPPGLDVDKFYPFYHDTLPESEKSETEIFARASVLSELNRFFKHSDKPIVLSLCRPDKRKNIAGLIKSYGEDLELQSMANLAVFAGIRKDISAMEDNERDVLTEILLLMDKYDLYGKMAVPKKHDFEYEVPELYRIAAERGGVFVNPALTEPFGITLIESAACGLPIVAPDDGGPQDIIANCQCGVLVDTTDTQQIAAVAKMIIVDTDKWKQFSKAGILNIRKHYTWNSHAATYVKELKKTADSLDISDMKVAVPTGPIGRRLTHLNHFLVTDIDDTLIGQENPDLSSLSDLVRENRNYIGFCVATGRSVESATEYLADNDVPTPDIIISSVGSEIYYGKKLAYGKGWDTHISAKWDREKIVELLKDVPFLEYQEEETQRPFKVSYFMDPKKDRLAQVHDRLARHKVRYNLIYSNETYLDILPFRASKGKALRYISYKWGIPLANLLVCGDSGNDEEMLRGEPKAAVVGNHTPELKVLKGTRNVYFSKRHFAGGILEAIEHYHFIEKAKEEPH
jgi:sucrose-phosphate synthase